MKRPILRPIAVATSQLTALLLSSGMAMAEVRCAVPMTEWQPRDAVVQLAEKNGWKIRRIKIDDGCYEVVGTDAEGRKFEVKLHPATLAVMSREHDDESEDRKADRDRNSDDRKRDDHDRHDAD